MPRYEVAQGRQLVGHVEYVLPGGIAATNPNRLRFTHRKNSSIQVGVGCGVWITLIFSGK